jgi:hypothetical protein
MTAVEEHEKCFSRAAHDWFFFGVDYDKNMFWYSKNLTKVVNIKDCIKYKYKTQLGRL